MMSTLRSLILVLFLLIFKVLGDIKYRKEALGVHDRVFCRDKIVYQRGYVLRAASESLNRLLYPKKGFHISSKSKYPWVPAFIEDPEEATIYLYPLLESEEIYTGGKCVQPFVNSYRR